VWGFLKYYHPKVASGKLKWDETLVNNYASVKNMDNNVDFNAKISRLLDSVGIVPPARSKALDYPDSLRKNLNIKWIYDTTYLSKYNSFRLRYIYENHQPTANFYISRRQRVGNPDFTNENAYQDLMLPSEPYRILALFRYWNIINYYFPYLHLIDRTWDDVLTESVPRFINVQSDYDYFRRIQELSTKINDGHGMVYSGRYNYFARRYVVPVRFTLVGDKTYITDFLNDSLCRSAGVEKGDVLLKMDGFEVSVLREHHAKYMPASNDTYLNYKVDQWLSLVKSDSVLLELERNGTIIQRKIATVNNSKKLQFKSDNKYAFTKWRLLNDSVGYINMGLIRENDVNDAYNQLKNTKYLIVDSRNYPNWVIYSLANKLLKTKKPFMLIGEPDYDYPGYIKYISPLKAGPIYNSDYYKGTIILLVNTETMSRAEFTAMAIMQAEHVVIIGSQTAGADGDVAIIPLPGGIYSYYSGIGVYHPDGSETQRIGIVPDIVVTPTLEGMINKEDEYFERAMEYIRIGNKD
jgi:C-terminal processing protease CtpA/Prc